MPRFVSVLTVLALLVPSPLSVSAQAGEEGATREPDQEEAVPGTEVPDIDTLSQRAIEQYEIKRRQYEVQGRLRGTHTLKEVELRVRRAKIGLGVSAGVGVLGLAFMGGWAACVNRNPSPPDYLFPPECDPLLFAGVFMPLASAVGMITSGAILGVSKRKLGDSQQTHFGTRRRAQWDLARSRLVF